MAEERLESKRVLIDTKGRSISPVNLESSRVSSSSPTVGSSFVLRWREIPVWISSESLAMVFEAEVIGATFVLHGSSSFSSAELHPTVGVNHLPTIAEWSAPQLGPVPRIVSIDTAISSDWGIALAPIIAGGETDDQTERKTDSHRQWSIHRLRICKPC